MNYADLFRVTLPETVLEIAALLVLVVDLGIVRKAASLLPLSSASWAAVLPSGRCQSREMSDSLTARETILLFSALAATSRPRKWASSFLPHLHFCC